MIKITKRQKDMILFLVDNNSFVTVQSLSDRFGVSSRTLRYDLDLIGYFLKELKVELDRKPGFGIRLVLNDTQYKTLKSKLNQTEDYHFPSEERRRLELFYLLCEPLLTIDHLAQLLEVSKQTIQTDLSELDEELDSSNLRIIRKVRLGCYLSGKEIEIRTHFSKLYRQMSEGERRVADAHIREHCATFLDTSSKIIQNMENFQKFNFAHPEELKIIIAYNLYRSANGNVLPYNLSNQFEAGKLTLVEKLTNGFDLRINENDAMFFLESMLDAKVDSTPQTSLTQDEDEVSAKLLADFLLEGLDEVPQLSETENREITKNLQLHLKITLFRIRNKLNVENQILDRVKISIPLIYEYTKSRLIDYEAKSGLYFNEEEIAYIAMHIGAIVEKRALYAPMLSALVVCHFGIATSKIMVSRLNALIPEIRIVGPVSLDEAYSILSITSIDLIITTFKLNTVIETVLVSPLLSDEDVNRIKAKIYKNTYLKQCNNFIRSLNNRKSNRIRIVDCIESKHIQIRESITEWRDAIRLAAHPLVQERLIEKRYVERMIRAVEEFGNYMVILPETAFVHAGIDDGVNKPCVSLLVLKKPTLFGNQSQESIRNIVVIAVKKREDDIILKLAKIFENEENRKKLSQADITVEGILALQHEVKTMSEIINIENILVNQTPSDWEDAIKVVGNMLYQSGSIEPEYTNAMIQAVKELGPYIVIGKHIAIAHAAPDRFVHRNDLSLAILSEPVNFGSQNDPVKVLFALCSEDGKSHLEKLMELAVVIGENDEVVTQLSQCSTKEEAFNIINGVNNGRSPLSHRKGNSVGKEA